MANLSKDYNEHELDIVDLDGSDDELLDYDNNTSEVKSEQDYDYNESTEDYLQAETSKVNLSKDYDDYSTTIGRLGYVPLRNEPYERRPPEGRR